MYGLLRFKLNEERIKVIYLTWVPGGVPTVIKGAVNQHASEVAKSMKVRSAAGAGGGSGGGGRGQGRERGRGRGSGARAGRGGGGVAGSGAGGVAADCSAPCAYRRQRKPTDTALPYPSVPFRTLPYPTLPFATLPYPSLPFRTVPYGTQTQAFHVQINARSEEDLDEAVLRKKVELSAGARY